MCQLTDASKQKAIVFLATVWGTKFGGINSFNMDLATTVANLLTSEYKLFCIVASSNDKNDELAIKAGIEIIYLECPDAHFDEKLAYIAWGKYSNKFNAVDIEWWIGHDVITGFAANTLRDISKKGRSAVIKHMSYIDYLTYKYGVGAVAQQKDRLQEKVFSLTDVRFAVGPKLANSFPDGTQVCMLIPGLHLDIKPTPNSKVFNAITFGRLDPENDKIKQPRLAVSSFAGAIKYVNENEGHALLNNSPRMYLYGIAESGGEEEHNLQTLAQKEAKKAVNLISLPYTTDRDELFHTLKQASVALMLSWHEGFGLTGWEAISAEIPLIISQNSGLYEFIESTLFGPGLGCIYYVKIDGKIPENEDDVNFTETTKEAVQKIIIKCASNMEMSRINARLLKQQLINKGYTWNKTGKDFLNALGVNYLENEDALIKDNGIDHFVVNGGCDITNKKYGVERFASSTYASLMRRAVCYNQGEYAQYSIISGSIYEKMVKSYLSITDNQYDLSIQLADSLSDYLKRNIIRIYKENFFKLKEFFKDRHPILPRVCIKAGILYNDISYIIQVARDRDVDYFTPYPLNSNTAFTFVNSTGTYYLCNDIPTRVAEGSYINSRINLEAAIEYTNKKKFNNSLKIKKIGGYDEEWIKCWVKGEKNPSDKVDPTSCYKSTMIIPMTLWNVQLDPIIRDIIKISDFGRTIFGFLCLDHIDDNYFLDSDKNVGYVYADILSLYHITREIYTKHSDVFNELNVRKNEAN